MTKKLLYILTIICTMACFEPQIKTAQFNPAGGANAQAGDDAFPMVDPSQVLSSEQNEKMTNFFEQFENADANDQSPEEVFETIFEELSKPENEDVLNAINAYGEAIYDSMPEDQKKELMDAFEQGFDESNQQKQNSSQPAQPEPSTPRVQPTSGSSQEQVRIILYNLTQLLESIQQKAASSDKEEFRLRSWQEAINDVIYYTKIMNKRVHHQRLATKEFSQLLETIRDLQNKLAQYEPQFTIPELLTDEDDPYATLGVSSTASQKEIEDAFQNLKAEKSPAAVTQQLEKQDVPSKERQRPIKEARINFPVIEDAYEKLTDSKMRQQIDRTRSERMKHQGQTEQNAQQAVKNITQALSQAIYSQELLAKIEAFMKQYEPEELKKKKEIEQAEKERIAEQRRMGNRPSPRTQGPSRLEPRVRPGRARTRQDYDFDSYSGYDFPGSGFRGQRVSPSRSQSDKGKGKNDKGSQKGAKGSGQKGKNDKGGQDDTGKEKGKDGQKKQQKKPEPQITLSRRFKALEKQLQAFEKKYQSSETEKTITAISREASQARNAAQQDSAAAESETPVSKTAPEMTAAQKNTQKAMTTFAEDTNLIAGIDDSLPKQMRQLRKRLEDLKEPSQYKQTWQDNVQNKQEVLEKAQKQFSELAEKMPQGSALSNNVNYITSQLTMLNQEFTKIDKLVKTADTNE